MPLDPKKHEMPTQAPEVRAHNFSEVALGYTAEIALEDGSVRSEKDDVRNPLDAVEISWDLLGIDDLVPADSELCSSLGGLGRIIPYCHAEHVKAVAMVFLINALEVWHLAAAWAAP